MGFFDYIVACALALIGGALTFVLVRLILLQVLALLKIGGGKGKVRRAASRIEKADNYIQNNELLRAANQLQKAFSLENPPSKEIALRLKEHHQNVLSRCLIIAEEQGARIENIAEVERLLSTRVELQLGLLRNKETLREFESKRNKRGKKTPSWGTNEFVGNIKTAQTDLAKNRTDLNLALKGLFKSLQCQTKQDDIVYH